MDACTIVFPAETKLFMSSYTINFGRPFPESPLVFETQDAAKKYGQVHMLLLKDPIRILDMNLMTDYTTFENMKTQGFDGYRLLDKTWLFDMEKLKFRYCGYLDTHARWENDVYSFPRFERGIDYGPRGGEVHKKDNKKEEAIVKLLDAIKEAWAKDNC
jgi:hypothetical protein